MRKAIMIASVVGIVCIGLSAGLFLVNNSLASSLNEAALVLTLTGLAASLVAFFLCIVHLLRRLLALLRLRRQREVEFGEARQEDQESAQSREVRTRLGNARERRRQLFWTLGAFAAIVVILNIISDDARPYVGSPHFGAFVDLAALLIPLLTLLYGIVSRETSKKNTV
ncbi:MAG TPA: hypothetical protein VFQ36_14545 [Ktedonobacteraceae bacterium]|nr:hypothetical protein [Ktedonobacteraceae bacterium]HEU0002117.1 hypothetical protein [Ktedonobacteraceae bacterium]